MTPAIIRVLTSVERWICQKTSASSSSTSSLIGFRISASIVAVCTRVYFSSEMKNSTSSTGIIWMLCADRRLDPACSFGAAPGFICAASFCSSCCMPVASGDVAGAALRRGAS